MSVFRSRIVAAGLALSLLAGCGLGGNSPQATVTPPPTAALEGGLSSRPTATLATQSVATAAPADGPATTTPEGAAEPTSPPSDGQAIGFTRDLLLASPRLEGEDVRALQQRLLDLGYFQVGQADGIFGPATQEGVSWFQSLNNLPGDGLVDGTTWERLFSDQALGFEADEPAQAGRIVYVTPDGRSLVSMNPDGSDQQPFGQPQVEEGLQIYGLKADPSGRFIAQIAASDVGEVHNLYILNIDGTLLSSYGGLSLPNWSPDGSRFAADVFASNQGLEFQVWDTEHADESGPVAMLDGASPDWRADGQALVYVDTSNIFVYDLASQTSAKLTDLPSEGDEAWYIDEAHFSPDGSRIYFYAGQSKNVGASGNGMQWWVMASAGGSAGCSQRFEGCGEPVAFTAPNGNGVGEFAFNPSGDLFAYSEGAHISACSSVVQLWLRTTADEESPTTPLSGDLPADGGLSTLGFAWSPQGDRLAFSYQDYLCNQNFEQQLSPAEVYVWNPAESDSASKIAEGSFPIWLP
jgi:peptidoglycan hydrolase-like protein with peptidoglycan-binding domain